MGRPDRVQLIFHSPGCPWAKSVSPTTNPAAKRDRRLTPNGPRDVTFQALALRNPVWPARCSVPDAKGGIRVFVARCRRQPEGSRGFTLAELLVVLGMVGVLSAVSLPYFLMYWQSARIRTGAEELAAILNEGRQTAIAHNCAVTVVQATDRVQFQLATGCPQPAYCASLPCNWRGPGTDSNGNFRLAGDMQVSAASDSAVFNYLGAAVTPATYTVRDPRTGRTLSVVVARAGRVSIQ